MCVRMFQSICECVCVLLLTFTSVAELLPCPIWGGLFFFQRLSALKYATKLLWCLTCTELLLCVCDPQICMYVCVCLCQYACVCHFHCHNERETRVLVGRLHGLPWLLASRLSPPLTVSLSVCLCTHSGQLLLDLRKIKCLSHGKSGFLLFSLSHSAPQSRPHARLLLLFFSGFFFACHFDALTGKFWMQNPTTFSK